MHLMTTPRRLGAVALLAIATVGCSASDDDDARPSDPVPEEVEGEALYDVPEPLPSGEPGTLLRYERVDATVFRILYLSESRQGEPIAVTGLAAMPDGEAPAEGRPVLGMAHATTGIADACAPSRDLQTSELSLVAPFVAAGYLVAMSDYEGLGTPGRHPYLVGVSEGRSVLDAVRAARQLPGADAGDRFALAGYQQGGHAALWAAELAAEWAPDLTLVATFAGAPLSEMDFEWNVASSLDTLVYFFDLIVAGFHAGYPETDLEALLTPEGVDQLDVVDDGCAPDVMADTTGTRLADFIQPGAAQRPPWTTIAADNIAGTKPIDSPILLIHSATDEVVPPDLSATLAQRLCDTGQAVERILLPDGDTHLTATEPAYAAAFPWIEARFADRPMGQTCS
jgi:pimeloyl-ACP methyl ester carboxylesterase